MKILVVGGAGYIGSVVCHEMLGAGHEVVVFDNLSHGHRQAIPAGAKLVEGEMGDPAALESLFTAHSFDAVFHFAALIEAGESMVHPTTFFINNTAYTLGLLDAVIRHGVRRFIFSSTAAVYGDPVRTPIDESHPLAPTNAYGESKLLVERALDWLHRIHGLRYACLRYFNAAGAMSRDIGEDHHPESHLIPLILQVAQGRRENIAVFGSDYPTEDGTCVRDYIHVSDLASAHRLALEALQRIEKITCNLGNGKGFSVKEVIEAARTVTGHAIPAVEKPRRPGDPPALIAASDLARKELGWEPRYTSLEEIIRGAWEWRLAHPGGFGES